MPPWTHFAGDDANTDQIVPKCFWTFMTQPILYFWETFGVHYYPKLRPISGKKMGISRKITRSPINQLDSVKQSLHKLSNSICSTPKLNLLPCDSLRKSSDNCRPWWRPTTMIDRSDISGYTIPQILSPHPYSTIIANFLLTKTRVIFLVLVMLQMVIFDWPIRFNF